MMGWFKKLLPREDKFFDMFNAHAAVLLKAANELNAMLAGQDIEKHGAEIVRLEEEADHLAAQVLLGVRRSFITPFDRSDIKELIEFMDDAIDVMKKTVKTVKLYEQTSFEPTMKDMGPIIVESARIISLAVPLLSAASANAERLHEMAEHVVKLEDQSDDLHEKGLKELYRRYGKSDPMAFIVGQEIYGELEKVVDKFEDVANKINAIVIENV